MFKLFMNDVQFPVTPQEIHYELPNKNETIELISGGEINIPKTPGLKIITFDLLIPGVEYPFANYGPDGYKPRDYYVEILEELKTSKKVFQFALYRPRYGDGASGIRSLGSTNLKVTLEECPISESAENGIDLIASITLKVYEKYDTKVRIVEGVVADPDVEEPTLVPLYVSANKSAREGKPDNIPDNAWTVQYIGNSWDVDKRGREYLTPVMPTKANTKGTPNLSLSGVSLDIPKTDRLKPENTFTVKNDFEVDENGVPITDSGKKLTFEYMGSVYKTLWDVMAKRFGLTRQQTQDVTKNGVTRFGLVTITWAWIRTTLMADPWQIIVGQHSICEVSKGLGIPADIWDYYDYLRAKNPGLTLPKRPTVT